MAYDGIQHGNRVDHTTERKLSAKVVDSVLNYSGYYARVMSQGMPFRGKTQDYTLKITDSGLGSFVAGMETLSSSAADTTLGISYAHAMFEQPVVLPMAESFANAGPEGTIDLDQFKLDEAVAEARSRLGTAIYGTGTGDQPLGLGAIVDDATDVATIGGQARATYSALDATVTASGGTISLSKMATLYDTVSNGGITSESPTIALTTPTIWSLFEQLLQPSVRADYASVGYNALGLRSKYPVASRALLKGAAGFNSLSFRGMPIISDEKCTSGVLFMLNENYLEWRGRTILPAKYSDHLTKVSLGVPSTMEGVAAAPSDDHGWYFQKFQMMPNQAGMLARYWVIGQFMAKQFRCHGKLTGVTGV